MIADVFFFKFPTGEKKSENYSGQTIDNYATVKHVMNYTAAAFSFYCGNGIVCCFLNGL